MGCTSSGDKGITTQLWCNSAEGPGLLGLVVISLRSLFFLPIMVPPFLMTVFNLSLSQSLTHSLSLTLSSSLIYFCIY